MAETEPLSFFVKLDGPSGPMWGPSINGCVVQISVSEKLKVFLLERERKKHENNSSELLEKEKNLV